MSENPSWTQFTHKLTLLGYNKSLDNGQFSIIPRPHIKKQTFSLICPAFLPWIAFNQPLSKRYNHFNDIHKKHFATSQTKPNKMLTKNYILHFFTFSSFHTSLAAKLKITMKLQCLPPLPSHGHISPCHVSCHCMPPWLACLSLSLLEHHSVLLLQVLPMWDLSCYFSIAC